MADLNALMGQVSNIVHKLFISAFTFAPFKPHCKNALWLGLKCEILNILQLH